ncbi:hypothetical protein [Serratia marcescens]|uniref:hypothetical protein n=1 Tax=Serratia marcescens TaxID=615 RepID=UPI0021BD75C2|nr:hypothetical protein [Serratia marcescens]
MSPLLKLAVMAINTLQEQNAISLDASGHHGSLQKKTGHIFTQLAGRPTVISWSDAGFDELRISVWWDYDHSKHPQAYPELPDSDDRKEKFRTSQPLCKPHHYPKFVGVTLSFWLERRNGKWIQFKDGKFQVFGRYIRRGMQTELDTLPVTKPNGFEVSGKFYF